MKSEEEMDDFFNSLDEDVKKERERQDAFLKNLEEELIELSFKCYPECEALRNEIMEELKSEAHESALMMTELLDYLVCLRPDDSNENPEQYEIPKPEIEEDVFFQRKSDFKYSCHEKVKEMVTKHFPELADLSGNSIRNINHSAYCSILNFVTAFIYLTSDED
jgi:hypothetical protein